MAIGPGRQTEDHRCSEHLIPPVQLWPWALMLDEKGYYRLRLVIVSCERQRDETSKWFCAYCGDQEIRIGDIFTTAVRLEKNIKDFEKPREVLERRIINMKVEALHSYGEERGIVGPGEGHLIALSGADIDWLNQEWCIDE